MLPLFKRWGLFSTLAMLALFTLLQLLEYRAFKERKHTESPIERLTHPGFFHAKFKWKNVPQRHPPEHVTPLPAGPLADIPKIQHDFMPETEERRAERQARLKAVKGAFLHSWEGYKAKAWLQDEVAPVSGGSRNGFGGWGATMVDSLDTLWILGLEKEFVTTVAELRKVDFATADTETLSVFETTIRYLGGLLSAYDVSGQEHRILLEKAIDLGEMLYKAFDTPNRMPITRWQWKSAALGEEQQADSHSLIAEVGSLTLEFTRLSQLSGDHKWYDAVARITDVFEEQQNHTKVPGLWPIQVNTATNDFSTDFTFSFGAAADSLYEYFPKQHLMVGGRNEQYRNMYVMAIETAKEYLFFRPLNRDNQQLLIPGTTKRYGAGHIQLIPEGQHLTCFAGGMVALAAKAFERTNDLETARQLVDGCLWAYESMPSGIMPEVFMAASCRDYQDDNCAWSEERWYRAINAHTNHGADTYREPTEHAQQVIKENKLAPGFTEIRDSRYNLRPEAIESLFVLYRITGDTMLQDKAWNMFRAISNVTKTPIAYAGIDDVTKTVPGLLDTMESFWTAETLKYFYLIFSEPDVISLDDYVLNTEAHPLLRPK